MPRDYKPGDEWVDYPYPDLPTTELPYGSRDSGIRGDQPVRSLGVSSTVVGQIIPIVFGKRKIVGQIMAIHDTGTHIIIAWALSEGPVEFPGEEWINDEDLSNISWFTEHERHDCMPNQTPSPVLSEIPGLVEIYPGVAYQAGKITKANAEVPGSRTRTRSHTSTRS